MNTRINVYETYTRFIQSHGLSASTLKLIAIVSMLIDHTGAAVVSRMRAYPGVRANPELFQLVTEIYSPMRKIGRIAFPIFCFFIVEGFLHTRNAKKYAGRLFLFALISEIPFNFALRGKLLAPGSQNVYFTLLIGLLVLMIVDRLTGCPPLQVCVMIAGLFVASYLKTDYSFKGVFLIEALYLFRRFRPVQCAVGAYVISWEPPAPWAFLPILCYSGRRGLSLKYFFYWFYPVHLVILGLLGQYILPAVFSA